MSLTLFTLFKLFQLGTHKASHTRAEPLQASKPRTRAEDSDLPNNASPLNDQTKSKRVEPSTLSLHKARPLTAFQVQAIEGALGKPMRERSLARPAHKRLPSLILGNATASQSIVLPASTGVTPNNPAPQKTLRVLRVPESSTARQQAGRMVMSGTMRDVCAELDRLVRFEMQA